MKVTYRWLEEFVDISWSPEELAERLTLSGSEVESVEPVKSIFENIIIGHVTGCTAHPKAKHLKVCKIVTDNGKITVVCGAPNVKSGQNVVVALPGASLPNGKIINIAKIRGVDSYGMLCSENELGFSDVGNQIIELPKHHKPGEQFDPGNISKDYLLDIFINPNRPDCMSVRGLAREIAALSGSELKERPINLPRAKSLEDNNFEIIIKDEEKCPRYCGAIITGVQVRQAPYEIQQRLYAIGIRPKNNIVDATNYCLIEWGQPLHAFDMNLIEGNQIVVKTAKKGQKFTTLDSETRTLNEEVLLICDREKPVALGGIMGGENSEINQNTVDVFLESAYFNPENILRSSKFLGLHTEASHRFERGMDPNFCSEAIKRVCELILKCSPGQLHKPFFDEYPQKIRKKKIVLRKARLNKVLGTECESQEIVDSLNKLEISTVDQKNTVKSTVPTFRPDLYREIDLIEEVARIIGLEKIKPQLYSRIPLRNVINPVENTVRKLKSYMTQLGFMEIFTYSMIDKKLEELLSSHGELIRLKNPISPELSVMRPSLIPGLLNTAIHNYNRGVENLRLFELGSIFNRKNDKKKSILEEYALCGALYGQRVPPSWDHLDTPSDFFTVKGLLETLFRKIFLDKVEFISYDIPYLEECNSVILDGDSIGSFGRYRNNSLLVDFPEPIFLFELRIKKILKHLQKNKYFRSYSKYPPAKRDLAFVIPDSLPVNEVMNYIRVIGKPLLKYLFIDDVYRGQQIEFDRRSVKFSMKFFEDDRNLLDKEVDEQITKIMNSVREKFSIDIRR